MTWLLWLIALLVVFVAMAVALYAALWLSGALAEEERQGDDNGRPPAPTSLKPGPTRCATKPAPSSTTTDDPLEPDQSGIYP